MRVRMKPKWDEDFNSYILTFQPLDENLNPRSNASITVTPMHKIDNINQAWAEAGLHASQLGYQPVWTTENPYPF